MKQLALAAISGYQRVISPWTAQGVCRYHPSCSEYSRVAVSQYGVAKGALLTVRRLLRCTPFHAGGYDPVP